MHAMRKDLAAAVLAAMLVAVAGPASAQHATPAPTPNPKLGTPPPEIIHVYSRPLCSALKGAIAPAVGMMLQNDQTIAKSPPLFQDYVKAAFEDSGGAGDPGASPAQNLAVMRLENLVSPLADNILAIQKQLEDPSVFPNVPQTDDEKQLAQLKGQMMQALASQQASLDIINGFVDTQQLSAMQHEGFGYIASITGTNIQGQSAPKGTLAGELESTPDPTKPQLFDNLAIDAGLAPNPYEIDLAHIPGLAMGYNPVSRLKEGVEWTQRDGKTREDVLAKTIVKTARECGAAQPASSPTP
jgi:hypothetical protein